MSLELSGTTGVKGVAGSVAAPSIVGDDTNTGISFPAADTIKFSTGGVERMSITNSGITGISPGITMADQWRVNSAFSGTSVFIESNWERNDTQFAQIGTGMTQSSGVFTFPSTGIYLVMFNANAYVSASGDSRYVGCSIFGTSDNSNYNYRAISYDSAYSRSANVASSCTTNVIFDCTDTSNDKVKFKVESEISATWETNTDNNRTHATFIRLGDT